jgi:multidrug transporter EmrE-like cation transporter
VGFGVLNYPWTASTFAWGVAIGAAAVIGTLAAQWAVRRLAAAAPILARMIAGFVAAFVLYEIALYVVAVSVLGGIGAFTPAIVGQVLFANAVTLVGLVALHQLVVIGALVLSRRRRAQASPARLA